MSAAGPPQGARPLGGAAPSAVRGEHTSAADTAGAATAPRLDVSAIAFDLDGTLLDTVHDLAAAVNALLAELGHSPLPKDAVGAMIGKGVANLVRRALALALGVSPEAVDEAEVMDALTRYQAHYASRLGRETRLFPGMVEGLSRLAAMGFPLAVITNKSTRFVRPHLAHARIEPYFAVVIGGDDLPTKKPDPGSAAACGGPFRHSGAPAADGRRLGQRRGSRAPGGLSGAGGAVWLSRGAGGARPRGRWYSRVSRCGRRSRPLRLPDPGMSFDLFVCKAAAATARWRRAPAARRWR